MSVFTLAQRAALASFVAVASTACGKRPPDAAPVPEIPAVMQSKQPAPPATTTAATKQSTVTFKLATGDKTVKVEVVNTPSTIERGLMFRQHMPLDEGMLFLMPENRVHTFWMHNTLIALDMLFITKNFEVAGIVENAEPQTDTLRTVNKESQYVLEMNGGWCKANGVTPHTAVTFSIAPN
jgi:uncharacterized protein